MATAQLIRVLLVDDHTLVRQGVRSVLESYPNIDVVGQTGDGETAIQMAGTLKPDVVLMDVILPKMDGITATRFIKTNYPHIAVIGLSMTVPYREEAMLKAGAFEVVAKDRAVDDLYGAIQRAIASVRPIVILKDIPAADEPVSEKPASAELEVSIEKTNGPQDESGHRTDP